MGNAIKILKTTPEVKNTPWQSGQRSDFLAVLHDYPTPDISQPIFQVGEKLRVISEAPGQIVVSYEEIIQKWDPSILSARSYNAMMALWGQNTQVATNVCKAQFRNRLKLDVPPMGTFFKSDPKHDMYTSFPSEGIWWKACSLTTGKENYIPENCVARVYHGWLFEGIGREKAEELLLLPNNKTGSFMIRKSETTNGFYSLSVRHVHVKHYRIFRLPNNWYYITPRQTFQCLEDLVNHYSEVADGLCCILTTPCLTQHTSIHEVRNQEPPVVMRNKTIWWNHVQRSRECDGDIADMLRLEDSGLSYGLRNSIASYLALTMDDDSSFVRKRTKKTQSVICRSNCQSQPNFLYHED